MTVLLWVDALLFSLWFLTAVLCVLICRLMPSSPRKTSLSRSASSWTPARELGLTLPPGGKKHHLQLHCWLTHIYALQFVAHTHVCDYSFCMARLLGKLPASNWRLFIFTQSLFTVNTRPINQQCLSLGI